MLKRWLRDNICGNPPQTRWRSRDLRQSGLKPEGEAHIRRQTATNRNGKTNALEDTIFFGPVPIPLLCFAAPCARRGGDPTQAQGAGRRHFAVCFVLFFHGQGQPTKENSDGVTVGAGRSEVNCRDALGHGIVVILHGSSWQCQQGTSDHRSQAAIISAFEPTGVSENTTQVRFPALPPTDLWCPKTRGTDSAYSKKSRPGPSLN